nr:exonuclease SbcC [[Mycobacterium] manitobense]
MPNGPGDFALTLDELRAVARYAAESAQEVLAIFQDGDPHDRRPRDAIAAAWAFAGGAPRTALQRVASLDAHRAAREAADEAARHAARAAGDAASAAYLHPLAKATQVGHILRAAANAARAAELRAGDDATVGDAMIERARARATPVVIDVLCRYPSAPAGASRTAHLMAALGEALRGE